MLDVVNCVVFPCDVIVELLLFAAAHKLRQPLEHSAFGLGLVAFGNHFEEHVHVHALVDVEEEGDAFGGVQ